MEATPMCVICGEHEAGSFPGGTVDFCSGDCTDKAHEYMLDAYDGEDVWDGYDMQDDADALASAGWGTDEDYGYYGDE